MMRLTFVSWSFPVVLVSAMAYGQQTQPQATKGPAPQSAVKDSAPQSARAKVAHKSSAHHRVAHKRHTKASHRNGAKRAAYRPEFTEHSVEVINGASTKRVVFNDEPKPVATVKGDASAKGDASRTAKGASQTAKGDASQMKVEVMNGTSTDTQYFYAGNEQTPERRVAEQNRPVVIGVQSADTRVVGGNKHPVVTGITSSGAGSVKSSGKGGDSVTKSVAPRPKRPAYQPDAH